jgi:hypothetical protein
MKWIFKLTASYPETEGEWAAAGVGWETFSRALWPKFSIVGQDVTETCIQWDSAPRRLLQKNAELRECRKVQQNKQVTKPERKVKWHCRQVFPT